MKKKTLICFLIFTLVCSLGAYSLVYADDKADKQQELDQINEQKEDVKEEMCIRDSFCPYCYQNTSQGDT